LSGELSYLLTDETAVSKCVRTWALVGTPFTGSCFDCDFAFELEADLTSSTGEQWDSGLGVARCPLGYGGPDDALEGTLGFASNLPWEDEAVGWVEGGRLTWGSGGTVDPASGQATFTWESREPPVLHVDFSWSDPHGYTLSHVYLGEVWVE